MSFFSSFSARVFLGSILVLLSEREAAVEAYNVVSSVASIIPSSQISTYTCTWSNLWTSARHPNLYPADAAWSQSIAVTHSNDFTLFEEGTLATQGFGSFLTVGSTHPFRLILSFCRLTFSHHSLCMQNDDPTGLFTELVLRDDEAVYDAKIGSAYSVGQAPPSIGDIEVDDSHTRLSLVAKMVPSTDWFTGVDNIDLRDSTNGFWLSEVVLDLPPFDAGVLAGNDYTSVGSLENPQQSITEIRRRNVPEETGVFLSPDGSTVLPVARIICLLDGATRAPSVSPTTVPPISTSAPPTVAFVTLTGSPSVSQLTDAPVAATTVPTVANPLPTATSPPSVASNSGNLSPTSLPTDFLSFEPTLGGTTGEQVASDFPTLALSEEPSQVPTFLTETSDIPSTTTSGPTVEGAPTALPSSTPPAPTIVPSDEATSDTSSSGGPPSSPSTAPFSSPSLATPTSSSSPETPSSGSVAGTPSPNAEALDDGASSALPLFRDLFLSLGFSTFLLFTNII